MSLRPRSCFPQLTVHPGSTPPAHPVFNAPRLHLLSLRNPSFHSFPPSAPGLPPVSSLSILASHHPLAHPFTYRLHLLSLRNLSFHSFLPCAPDLPSTNSPANPLVTSHLTLPTPSLISSLTSRSRRLPLRFVLFCRISVSISSCLPLSITSTHTHISRNLIVILRRSPSPPQSLRILIVSSFTLPPSTLLHILLAFLLDRLFYYLLSFLPAGSPSRQPIFRSLSFYLRRACLYRVLHARYSPSDADSSTAVCSLLPSFLPAFPIPTVPASSPPPSSCPHGSLFFFGVSPHLPLRASQSLSIALLPLPPHLRLPSPLCLAVFSRSPTR
ncbi:hypothetical protein FB451DRAFT_1467845 [Mycena latifolia]|nr:hypothetical protein FB451DRAFT_1467845 [Mycena latifolia]